MEIITEVEYEEQWYESLQDGDLVYHSNGFDLIGKCWNRYFREFVWRVQLRPGLYVMFDEDDTHTPINIEFHYAHPSKFLISKFYLSGSGQHGMLMRGIKGVPEECVKQANHNYLWFPLTLRELELGKQNRESKKSQSVLTSTCLGHLALASIAYQPTCCD